VEETNTEKRKDVSYIWQTIVIALVLALCAGFYVYFKNQAKKKQADIHNLSEWNIRGTKLNNISLDGVLFVEILAQ